MRRTVVIDVVGLTPDLVGEHTPALRAFAERGKQVPLRTITPAVTCAVQSTFLTGTLPREHGCVANGWYFRELNEVWLWRQSNRLVEGEKLWDAAKRRDGNFTCANLFWWYAMASNVDLSVTPRPIYRADGRKLPDVHTDPVGLRDELTAKLGTFPLFNFWGPRADITSSRWIGAAAEHVFTTQTPTLTLVYLPHLDYDLQRFGPDDPRIAKALHEIDEVCGRLIEVAEAAGAAVVVLSEYGITRVSEAVHINRALRRAGLLAFREECGEEHFDPGLSEAFAVADHQIAHVYVKSPRRVDEVKAILEGLDGIELVLAGDDKRAMGLDHPRSGELVAISRADRWFSYYWWLEDRRAPDYARTVDIHRKPGYDPVELFVDPGIPLAPLYIASRLLRSKVLNVRTLLDVIALDSSLVKGSHGRVTDRADHGPLFITNEPGLVKGDHVDAVDVKQLLLDHVF